MVFDEKDMFANAHLMGLHAVYDSAESKGLVSPTNVVLKARLADPDQICGLTNLKIDQTNANALNRETTSVAKF